jgi:hypothetical protein
MVKMFWSTSLAQLSPTDLMMRDLDQRSLSDM